MTEIILAWTKRLEIRGGDFPGFHFWWPEASRWQQLYLCYIPSGLAFPRAAWIVPPRPCPATKQVGRGFRGIVKLQKKCRSDEHGISASAASGWPRGTRSVIRRTNNCAMRRLHQNGPRPPWTLCFSSPRNKFRGSIVTWADEVIQ